MRCSVCGSKMISTTISHDCPVCGHKTPSDISKDSSNSTGMEFECCPVCGGKLERSFEANVSKECNNCGYKILAYTGDITKYNQHIPDTNSLVNEPDNKPGGLYGWICPKCGAVLSPFVDCCPNCTQRNWTFTCNTGGNLT